MPPHSAITLRLFGGMHLQIDGVTATAVQTERLQTLLAFLAQHRDHPLRRDYVAFTLWPDLPETVARRRLRKALYDLRTALPCLEHLLVADGQSLYWREDASVAVDVVAFEEALVAASRFERDNRLALATEQLEAAVTLYAGDLMPENYHEWFALRRRQLHNRFVDALQSVSLLMERRQDDGAAIAYIKVLLQHEPDLLSAHSEELHESTFSRLLSLSGRHLARSDVEWAYRMYVYNRARYELPMSVQMLETYETALLRATAAADIVRKVPSRLTPFLGRGRELAELTARLTEGHCRLLTVTGVAGIGKTSVAQHLALTLGGFVHGVYFVAARNAQSERQLLQIIAQTLELAPSREMDLMELICRFLADKRILVVLDNYEHLVHITDWLRELLACAAGIKVLVTSRARLNVAGEWIYELGGMGYDASPGAEARRHPDADDSAVALFLQTAQRVDPGFAPTEDDRDQIVRICKLVEGLPLAVELAAAWVRLFSCRRIAARIAQDLDLLSDGTDRLDDYHDGMRAALDYSWTLLAEEEQRSFLGLCTFTDGFDVDAAMAVTGIDATGLAALIDSSFIRKFGTERYDIHNLIYQYGQSKLIADSDLRHRLYDAHCAYYANLISTHTQALKDSQTATVRRLRPDLTNVVQAWQWALNRHNRDAMAHLCFGVGILFYELALFQDGFELFKAAIDFWLLGGTEEDTAVAFTAKLRVMAALLAQMKGDLGEAELLLDAAEPVIETAPSEVEWGLLCVLRGMIAFYRGEYTAAEAYCRSTLKFVDDHDFVQVWAAAHIHLGDIERARGNYAKAERLYLPSLNHPKARHSARGFGINLWRLGAINRAQGKLDEAGDAFREGLAVAKENGDDWIAQVLLNQLGDLASMRAQFAEGETYYRQALQIAADVRGSSASALDSIVGFCAILDRKGRSQRGYQYLATVLIHPTAQHQTLLRAGALMEEISDRIPTDRAHALQLRGRAKPLNVVIAELLLM